MVLCVRYYEGKETEKQINRCIYIWIWVWIWRHGHKLTGFTSTGLTQHRCQRRSAAAASMQALHRTAFSLHRELHTIIWRVLVGKQTSCWQLALHHPTDSSLMQKTYSRRPESFRILWLSLFQDVCCGSLARPARHDLFFLENVIYDTQQALTIHGVLCC